VGWPAAVVAAASLSDFGAQLVRFSFNWRRFISFKASELLSIFLYDGLFCAAKSKAVKLTGDGMQC
jgi:hypothetical protein